MILQCVNCSRLHGQTMTSCVGCGGDLKPIDVGNSPTAAAEVIRLTEAIKRALTFYQTTHIHAVLQAALRGDVAEVEAKGVGGRVRPELGDVVEWVSQAHGSTKTKRGNVVEVVGPFKKPDRDRFVRLNKEGGTRDHESYVVAVHTSKRGGSWVSHVTPKIYWPRANALHIVQSEEKS